MQMYQVPVPHWARNAVIYEVNLRQYSEAGTIKGFIPHLKRLRDLGFDILWFMPVYPIGVKNRKGSLGSYYSIRDFREISAELGTKDDFRKLVDKAHSLGMKVLLDWVANHSSWDNELIFRHSEWYTRNAAGNVIVPEGTDWSDVADFDYSNRALWDYKIDAMRFWLEEMGVDGFRCDVAGMVPTPFWDEVYRRLISIRPDLFMLAEWDDPALHEKAFHMSYAWEVHKLFQAIWQGRAGAAELRNELRHDASRYLPDAIRMHFTSNHDENTWNGSEFERLADSRSCFAALTYLLPGMPLVYSGQEAGNPKRLSFFDRDPIDWKEDESASLYRSLNRLKHNHPALWNGSEGGSWSCPELAESSIFAIERNKDRDQVMALFNLSPVAALTAVPLQWQGSWKDQNGRRLISGENISLSPWEYLILTSADE
jgi:cyclomaltodextrinase / maltogenic alpha-amylase / neopullulanase